MEIDDCRKKYPALNTLENISHPPEIKLLRCWTYGAIWDKQQDGITPIQENRELENEKLPVTWFSTNQPSSPWFYFAVPLSYPLFDGKKVSLQKVYVLFSASDDLPNAKAEIATMRIYDGVNKKFERRGLHRTGDHSIEIDRENIFDFSLDHIEVTQSIGISVKVDFSFELSTHQKPKISFNQVGIELKID